MSETAPWLTEFPWRSDELAVGELYEFAWQFDLPVTREEMWPYLIDSSRFNKAIGYDGITYSEENGLFYGVRGEGKAREEWIEYPFEWSKPFYVHRMRKYSRGFITYNKTIFFLTEKSGTREDAIHGSAVPEASMPVGTREDAVSFDSAQDRRGSAVPVGCTITVYIGNISAHPLARKLIPGFFRPLEDKYRTTFDKIAAAVAVQKSAESLFDLTRLQLSDERQRLLTQLLQGLPASVHPELRDRLRNHITTAEMDALARIRPLALARAWQSEANDVLNLFLHATRAGIFTLTWNTICPHCRGERDSVVSLGSLPENSHCAVCDIDFAVGDIHSVEVNFRLNSQIADLPRVMYCSAEPSKKQHILIQQLIEPGDKKIPILASKESTRIRYQTGVQYRPATPDGKVEWHESVLNGQPALQVHNATQVGVQLVYEKLPWGDDILTPGAVFRLQEFRDLFSEEHLGSQLKLDVGEQTIMFTDLVGSTRFYEEAGDAQAFGTLREYFRTIYDEARRAGGAVVKTIGDGAMLVFADPQGAMRAAVKMLRHFSTGTHRLRITLNTGPCLAVNFNTGIDYFGKTVNLAAKLQTDCAGQQILCTSAILRFPGVQALVGESGLSMSAENFEHPAFTQKIAVFRVQ